MPYVLDYWRSQEAKGKAKALSSGQVLPCRDCGDARAVEDATGTTDGLVLLAQHKYLLAEVWVWGVAPAEDPAGGLLLSKQPRRGRGWVKELGTDFGLVLRRNPALKAGLTPEGEARVQLEKENLPHE